MAYRLPLYNSGKLRPLPSHPGFIALLTLFFFGFVSLSSSGKPPAVAESDYSVVDAKFISVLHEPTNRRNSWPDSVITIQTPGGTRQDIRIWGGRRLMEREWEKLTPGDEVRVAYGPVVPPDRQPPMMVMRNRQFYIDQQMLIDRMNAHERFRQKIGYIAMAISIPWMFAWGWLRNRRAKREPTWLHSQNATETGTTTPAPSEPKPKTNKHSIYHYLAAALVLPASLYGLVTGDNRSMPITVIGCILMMWAIKRQKK